MDLGFDAKHAIGVGGEGAESGGSCRVDPEAATEVWLVIPKVMRAAVGLENKGVPTPVTVAVFGPNEAGPGKNAWATSEYLVFQ